VRILILLFDENVTNNSSGFIRNLGIGGIPQQAKRHEVYTHALLATLHEVDTHALLATIILKFFQSA
jgi:hypothetical protein